MFRSILIVVFIILCFLGYAQQNYFQQEVNYNIDVKLNDVTHELSAFETIQYINNSPASLNYIYFHLWPNAYKNNETALAKQLLQNGETTMYFAKAEDLGYIDSLNFQINGKTIKWEFDPEHIDICKLYLNEPVKSLDTITISTPFHVKIPSAKISRLGHIDQAYAITQWYPKPAVFDKDGWHQMPYLTQGEFYSEFGSFDVNITLPKNYLLAATGDRIDALEEEEWLKTKVYETEKIIELKNFHHDNSFPESSKELKTIHFRQYRVHDFAWFADKRFRVLKGETFLPNTGSKVDIWAFFTNNEPELWSKSLEYINDATAFYSMLNGDYPYNHITAIDGTISAGGGMEYPNITIIGESNNAFTLETTIMHEVGHNWFYGILGSNERTNPAMDEGLNSFYEMRYIQTKYPNYKLTALFGKDSTFKFFGLNQFPYKAQYYFSYLIAARKNLDQPIQNNAEDFTPYNYGGIVYSKSALVFDYLMRFLGQEKFDQGMRFYFEQWKFKHPTMQDLIKTLSYHLNTDLTWFLNDLVQTNHKIDYKIVNHKKLEDLSHAVLIKNSRQAQIPVSLSGLKNGTLVGTVWYNGFKGKRVFEFPPSDVDEFIIDYKEEIPEINRKNNNYKTHGLFKRSEPLRFSFVGKLDNPKYNQVNYIPIAGYNQYNKFMLGCAFYNYSILQKKLDFTFAPMYAFGSKTPTGFAEINRNILPNNSYLQQITWSTKFKSFAYDDFNSTYLNDIFNTNIKSQVLNYYKISSSLDFEIKKKYPRSHISQHVGYTFNNIFADRLNFKFDSNTVNVTTQTIPTIINNAYYQLKNNRVINPFSVRLDFQHNDLFGKISSQINYAISFKNKKSLDIRFFAGAFVFGSDADKGAYRFRMSGFSGYQDYLFDYNYVGRNEQNGVGFAQFTENDGAFKVWTPLGQSAKWLVSMNIKSPTLGKLPLKLYADIGASEFNESLLNSRVLYDAGVEISIWKNIFEIFIPAIYSQDIKNALTANNKGFLDTIRFTLNLHNLNPKQIISNNLF